MWDKYYSELVKHGLFADVESKCLLQIYASIFARFRVHIHRALELGCGLGRYTLITARHCDYAIGVDIQIPTSAKKLIKDRPNIDLVVADVRYLPFRDNLFDLVHSQGLYEHFTDEERKNLLRESVRVLRKRGILFFTVPNALNVLYRVGKFVSEIRGAWIFGFEKPLSIKDILCDLNDLKLIIIACGGISFLGQIFDIPSMRKILNKLHLTTEMFSKIFKRDWKAGIIPAIMGRQFFIISMKQ